MGTNKVRQHGFTLVEMMIVVTIVGLLAVISIPHFIKARSLSERSTCLEAQRIISGAKAQWAVEKRKTPLDTPTFADLVGDNLYIRTTPQCPGSGSYELMPVDEPPKCSISYHTF